MSTRLDVGARLGPETYRISRDDLAAYAEASGDHNPIHRDEAVAREVGLPGVIAHGMYTLALVGRAVSAWAETAEVVELGAAFTRPVVVPAEGTSIEVSGLVRAVDDGLVRIDVTVRCGEATVLGRTRAVVRA